VPTIVCSLLILNTTHINHKSTVFSVTKHRLRTKTHKSISYCSPLNHRNLSKQFPKFVSLELQDCCVKNSTYPDAWSRHNR
jgi:hypothetical protein